MPIRARWRSGAQGRIRTSASPLGENRGPRHAPILRVLGWQTGLQPVRFSRAHAPVQIWRKADESNAHRSSRCPGFQDRLPAIQRCLPHMAESTGVEPVSLLRELLFSTQAPYRPAHSPYYLARKSPFFTQPSEGRPYPQKIRVHSWLIGFGRGSATPWNCS